jgi:steroid Delta-isomerase
VSDRPQLLREHVERFNAGVRGGDFGPMLAAFDDEAELVFEGVPVGPFRGRAAIAEAYRTQPPDDEVLLLDLREEAAEVVAGYAWSSHPGVRAGEMRLAHDGATIRRLVVAFERV